MKQKIWAPLLFGAIALFAFAAVTFAHAAILWAYVENNHVYVEAFFSDGAKVKNGRILVLDSEGKILLEGKTDEEGKFDFAPPIQDDMTIQLLIDRGHKAEFKLKKSDFQAGEETTPASAASPTPAPEPSPTPTPASE